MTPDKFGLSELSAEELNALWEIVGPRLLSVETTEIKHDEPAAAERKMEPERDRGVNGSGSLSVAVIMLIMYVFFVSVLPTRQNRTQ